MSEMNEAILKMENITKRFPGTLAVDDMSFEVRRGEVHALLGENGAGKSTLVKIISGAFNDYTGDVYIDGKKIRLDSPNISKENGIAMIYQELSLALPLTIAENILAGRLPVKGIFVDNNQMQIESRKMLDKVGLNYLDPNIEISQISQHEMQLVEIAKALGRNPSILVMDEPTSALTRIEVEMLFEIIQKLKESGLAIIYISHHLPEVFKVADRVTVMRDGRKIGTFDVKDVTSEKLVSLMVGRDVDQIYSDVNKNIGEEVLRVQGLYRYGFFHDVSFHVNKGEVLGICGLSGAGRSEIGRSIAGLDSVDSGKVFLEGKEIKNRNMAQAVNKGIVYLSENRKSEGLALRMTVNDNVVCFILKELSPNYIYNKQKGRPIVQKKIEYVELAPPNQDLEASTFSGGNQQKILLAKCLAAAPKVLILDEPTRGVDVGAKKTIHEIILELTRKGLAIILISSDLPELVGLSHRVMILREGHIIGEMNREECTEETVLLAANGEWGEMLEARVSG